MDSADKVQAEIVGHSTVEEGSKRPYTVYHIRIRVNNNTTSTISYDIKKRYSDFDGFNSRLIKETGREPPKKLPPKSVSNYYKSLLSSLGGGPGPNANDIPISQRTRRRSSFNKHTQDDEDLVSQRQDGLDAYLQAIINAKDPRWRKSHEWIKFLEIPISHNDSKTVATSSSSSYAITDPVRWLESLRDAKALVVDAKQQLLTGNPILVKTKLAQISVKLSMLEAGLSPQSQQALSDAGFASLGQGELRRRMDLIDGLKRDQQDVADSITHRHTAAATPTTTTTISSSRVLGKPIPESKSTVDKSNNQLLQLQLDDMQQQDQQIKQLHEIISRQKQLGLDIGSELQLQNEMLGLLQEEADITASKVKLASKRIDKIH